MNTAAQPLRVAQVLNRMDSGGIETVVMNYYRHIDHEQIQFDFYFAENSTFPQRKELERLGAGICPIPPYSRPLAYHWALYRAFRQRRYQIVHAHLSTMSVFALFAAWRAGVPVRICHNHSTAHWGEGKKTLLKYLLRPFNKLFATDWLACGEKAGRWMYGDRAFEKGRVRVMPNAIETEKFAFDPAARARLRRELGIPQEAFVAGHVGRFTYAKNHAFLVQVFASLKRQCPNARLLLVGEGELAQQIKDKVAGSGLQDDVVFTGARADVNKLYSAMDVFCLPSLYEGLPVVALEAQANGLPCLFSDRVPAQAVVAENARQLALEDPAEWASALPRGHRARGAAVPELSGQAARLGKFYLRRARA
ncbi:MAG TPA: glycosyltransferase family 1 protein [Candidatus Fournierella merdigallinarum]|nr:glycosyltransferase family 1 protein [Candidatus Fournierella merdigallinarum]